MRKYGTLLLSSALAAEELCAVPGRAPALQVAHAQGVGRNSSAPIPPHAPFQPGETLDYAVAWNSFLTAATLRLQTPEIRPFYGHTAWHFRARAETIDPVRFLYPLDDQFDSYTDVDSLRCFQFEMYLNEKNKKETHIIRMRIDGEASQQGRPAVRVLPGTRDPLGVIFVLRTLDWARAKETTMPVFDGRKLYDLRVRLAGTADRVSITAGEFTATKLDLQVFEKGRELANTRFSLWLAADATRTPVLIEATLPFGTLRVELTQARR